MNWLHEAACAGVVELEWIDLPPSHAPAYRRTLAELRDICRGCPVGSDCLQYALSHDVAGVWSGTTEKERAVWRREARLPAPEPLFVSEWNGARAGSS